METKTIEISKIKPNPKNPKKHWVEKISESIREMGYIEPIVVDENDVILAGHGRLKALKQEGIREVEVIVKRGLTERQKEKYLLLSNKVCEAGGWDEDLLKAFESDLLLDAGFSQEDLDNIFGFEIDDEYDVEKELNKILATKERRVKDGDIWQLGEHRLLIGDCTKRENWEKLLSDERFDFCFTDPPYQLSWFKRGEGFGYKKQKKYLGTLKAGKYPEYEDWLKIAKDFQNLKGSSIMVFENWVNYTPLRTAIENNGWKVKNMIIWYKTNKHFSFFRRRQFANRYEIAFLGENEEIKLNEEYEKELDDYLKESGQKLLDSYEIILYGQNKSSYWGKKAKSKWVRIQDHISWVVDTEKNSTTDLLGGTKPIQILVPYIKILSPREGIVVEPFCGSGSTLIACEIMNRKARCIEISEIYGEVIINRWEKMTGKKAIKIE
ncbi:MAG: site-specific DNA-methyltransferase [Bacillota bacterium]